jgi:hypothetical protein
MMRHRLTGNTPEQAAENSCLLSGHDFKSPGNGLENDGLLAPATVKVADEMMANCKATNGSSPNAAYTPSS